MPGGRQALYHRHRNAGKHDPLGQTHAREIGLGFLHPEQYVVAFELAAFLLTVALVAAVYIARRRSCAARPL